MQVNINSTLANKVYTITITAFSFLDKERAQADKFGPIEVSAGGTFEGPPLFNLGGIILRIDPRVESGFTHTQIFSLHTEPTAAQRAQVYVMEMQRRILSSKSAWDGLQDIVQSIQFGA